MVSSSVGCGHWYELYRALVHTTTFRSTLATSDRNKRSRLSKILKHTNDNSFVCQQFTAVVLAVSISISKAFFENNSIWLSLLVGFTLWFVFSATTLITHNAFEQKPKKLTWINNGYQLVLFLSMAVVIGLFR